MDIEVFTNTKLDLTLSVIMDDNGELWFKARDVAKALGYTHPTKAVLTHVSDEYKTTFGEIQEGTVSVPFHKTHPMTVFVSEPGLYSLIFSSHLPIAEKFRKWVFEDVLPSLRKTGKYIHRDTLENVRRIDCKEIKELPPPDCMECKYKIRGVNEELKDLDHVEGGRRGGTATWENIREIKEERNSLLKDKEALRNRVKRLTEKNRHLKNRLDTTERRRVGLLRELVNANRNLDETLEDIDERDRYIRELEYSQ